MSKSTLLVMFLGALTPLFSQTQAAATGQTQASASAAPPVNQRKVDSSAMYHRIYAVVPMIGTGKKGDPFRPMFVPATPAAAGSHSGILAYQMHVSDDGKFALVELVAATRLDLLPVINANAPGVTVFERGNASQAQIETEFQKYKKDFKMSLFNTRVQ